MATLRDVTLRRALTSLFAALIAVGLLSGCAGGSDSPRVLPSPTATPSASASPVPVPPQATPHTPQGAAAFVRFFFDQLNVAFSTSDAALVRRYSTANCGTCTLYAKSLEYGRSHGLRIEGDSFAITDVQAVPVASGSVVVEALGDIPAKKEVDATGRTVDSVAGHSHFHCTVILTAAADAWRVSDIRIDG